jgi:hypothetical protein
MELKYKLPNLDGLDDNVKGLYKESDGEYVLNIEGLPTPSADDDNEKRLKEIEAMAKKNKELLDEVKKNKEAKRALEEAKRKEEEERLKQSGDHEALAKSYQEKLAERDAQIKEMIDKNNATMIDNTVKTLASKLCDGSNVSLIEPHIRKRLGLDEKGELRVLDSSGQPSVTTQEELISEFQSNKTYAPIIRGTQSSGGGAHGSHDGGATDSNLDNLKPLDRLIRIHEEKAAGGRK